MLNKRVINVYDNLMISEKKPDQYNFFINSINRAILRKRLWSCNSENMIVGFSNAVRMHLYRLRAGCYLFHTEIGLLLNPNQTTQIHAHLRYVTNII